jgi:iron complex transport system substrate-binding protein
MTMTFSGSFKGRLVIAAAVGLLMASAASAADEGNPSAQRIVSIGGTITEILYALGAQDRIAAVDSTSGYPSEAGSKPDVGYMRALSAEGILAQKPDLILTEEGSGPPPVLDILKASSIPMVTVATPPQGDAIGQKIRDIGTAVGLATEADALADKTESELKALSQDVAKIPEPRKRVLFVLSLANGRIMAGGADTEAAEIIRMAGGINAAPEITGYKPLSDEAVIAAKPDVILTMTRGNHQTSAEEVFALPAFQTTPAAADKALISMDGLLLLGFGPRTPEATRELSRQLYAGGTN